MKYNLIFDKIGNSESIKFISYLKKFPYSIDPNEHPKLNRLCSLEDWDNEDIRRILFELHKLNPPILIHRKDWEWAVGILAMERLNKLNEDSIAIGIGSGY